MSWPVPCALALVLGLAVVLSAPRLASSQLPYLSYGKFTGNVSTEWLPDGRKMRLLTPFTYLDPKGQEWQAPAGWVVDGASIPRLAWSVIGGPFEGQYRNASVIHDVACDQKQRPWESVHEAFYYAMRASGVPSVRANVMFAAVYHFGPRWVFKVDVPSVPRAGVDGAVREARAGVDPHSRIEVAVRPRPRSEEQILANVPESADLTVTIVPPERRLQEADFGALKTIIEERSASGRAMSLEDIRTFGASGAR